MAASVAPGTRIGHVHLKVADLDRAIGFYAGVLGFELQQKFGDQAAFLSAGGYHHHIGLNTWESLGGTPPPPGHTGLYHTAILYPTRADLADALRRLNAAGHPPRRGVGPRRLGGALPARPRRQRRRALLGPRPGGLAARRRRTAGDGHAPARPRATCWPRPEAFGSRHSPSYIPGRGARRPAQERIARARHRPDAARLDRAPPRRAGRGRRLCLAARASQPKDLLHERTLDGLPEGFAGHSHRAEAERAVHGSARLRRVMRLVPGGPKVEVESAGLGRLRLRRVG